MAEVKVNMTKTGTVSPPDNRNPEKLLQRVRTDLTWIVISVAAAVAAAAIAYAMIP